MKRLLIVATILLSGCSLWDAYFMAHYDNNEHALLANIRTSAELGQANCRDRELAARTAYHIYFKSAELANFSEYIPNNEDTFKMATALLKETTGLYQRYHTADSVSEVYCKNKLKLIERSARQIQESTARRPR